MLRSNQSAIRFAKWNKSLFVCWRRAFLILFVYDLESLWFAEFLKYRYHFIKFFRCCLDNPRCILKLSFKYPNRFQTVCAFSNLPVLYVLKHIMKCFTDYRERAAYHFVSMPISAGFHIVTFFIHKVLIDIVPINQFVELTPQ